jgi:hypothetical protein
MSAGTGVEHSEIDASPTEEKPNYGFPNQENVTLDTGKNLHGLEKNSNLTL